MNARIAIFLILSLFALPLPQAWAQQPKHRHMMEGHHHHWLPEDLQLTDKQIERIESIERRYREDIRSLRHELLNKRYSLQRVLSDPTAKSSEIKAKQKEIFALENQIQEKILDYQLEMREILTPEQFRRWGSRDGMSFGHGMHRDRGMGMMDR